MLDEVAFQMRSSVLRSLLSFLRVGDLYQTVAEPPESPLSPAATRARLTALLTKAEAQHPFFAGKFSAFLSAVEKVDDRGFFERYAQLPVFSKEDYRRAGTAAMARAHSDRIAELELRLDKGLRAAVRQLRAPEFILPMSTGGSSKSPLTVHMTREHTFVNLFTFFRCWRHMGWRPGDKVLIFYPGQTYNIDDLAQFNRFSALTGLRFLLFQQLDTATVRRLVDTLNRYRPRLLLIFPSPLNAVAHTIRTEKLRLRHQPELINVSGETFLDCQRQNIKRVFSASRIEDSYGSVELGEIAHQSARGLDIFSDLAYVETRPQSNGQAEMIVTRIDLIDFPFIRYQMHDLARLEAVDEAGIGRVLAGMEGKDVNFVRGPAERRLYPSFFNRVVSAVNDRFADPPVVEIKVVETSLAEWEIRLVTLDGAERGAVERAVREQLKSEIGDGVAVRVLFVDHFDHDYRLKYRVIERRGETEYAGGILGNEQKMKAVEREARVARSTAAS